MLAGFQIEPTEHAWRYAQQLTYDFSGRAAKFE
jgi:hypothetical protein